MAFIETPRFPDDIAMNSRGGPGYLTNVVVVDSGAESRNARWTYPRHEYDLSYGIRATSDLENVIGLFHVCRGRLTGFRLKDPGDYKSCKVENTTACTDVALSTGTGNASTFLLVKRYSHGSYSRKRNILKPVAGTVRLTTGTNPVSTAAYTINHASGKVTFSVAQPSSKVKAGFQFDVPVRFDVDRISVNWQEVQMGAVQIPLIELKYGDT